jgi:hypothetical protein
MNGCILVHEDCSPLFEKVQEDGRSSREFRKLRNVKFFTLRNFMHGLGAVLSL